MKLHLLTIVLLGLGAGCSTTQTANRTGSTAPTTPIQAATSQRDTLPAGTQLAIRVNQEISTKEAGGTYPAEIAQDVVNQSGQVLIPRGSPAELAVINASSGGAVGTRTITLSLKSVTVNGQRRQVASADQQQRGNEGIGANRRTAETVGGGAALGALLGAVIGGGQGAAVGAAVGAAGGAAAQVLTRGDQVRVPAESVLTFRLEQPMQLT